MIQLAEVPEILQILGPLPKLEQGAGEEGRKGWQFQVSGVRIKVCTLNRLSCPTLQPYEPQPARLLCPWDSPGKNTGVGCHVLLQGIFTSWGSSQSKDQT